MGLGDGDIHHTLCLILQCNGVLKQDVLPRCLMGIHFKGQGLLLRTTLMHCNDYIVTVAK